MSSALVLDFLGLALLLGRLFRASLLGTGQPSRAELLGRMLAPAR